ncbi:heavy-metal-associated domain-containing protein [Aurantibacter sp.]|uniref:heavy-metal-associated domain-containing protein n=1 Tax=Aurantibacter sp. TaxID=2807103 RepID=UPI0035C7CEFA
MTFTYNISGMTCGGCKASVEKQLNALSQIESALVDLELNSVSINASRELSVEELQKALLEKFTITKSPVFKIEAEEKSDLKQLFPLFLIFLYITVAALFLNLNTFKIEAFMFDFMGLFYIVFSFFKFLDYQGFPKSFKMYDPLAKKIPFYAWIYPFIEAALGILFLTRIEITLALIVTLIVLGITTVGVTNSLLNKSKIQCACLGTALKLPMTKATFIENSIMLIMAIFMLIKIYN